MTGLKIVYLSDKRHRRGTNSQLVETLMEEHNSALLRFIRIKARCSRQEAEDTLQEVYVKLLNVDDLNKRLEDRLDTVRSFLFQIANNLLIDKHRRATSRRQGEHISEQDSSLICSLHSPERTHRNLHKIKKIQRALEQTRPMHQKAFLLHRVDGKSYREISDIMGVSVSTVEKYISAALMAIRNKVEEE